MTLDADRIARSVASLLAMRRGSVDAINRLLGRLESQIAHKPTEPLPAVRGVTRSAESGLSQLRGNLRLAARLRRLLPRAAIVQIVGVSLRRLALPLDDRLLPTLETLTVANDGRPLVDKGDADLVVVLDPAGTIDRHDPAALPAGVALATPTSLVLAAIAPLAGSLFGRTFWRLFGALGREAPSLSLPWKLAILAVSIATDALLAPRREVRFSTTTSNSVLLEVVRFWVLQATNATSAEELMHGVPAPMMDAYFSEIASGPPGGATLTLIPQLPLPEWSPPPPIPDPGNVFANPAINRFFHERVGNYRDWSLARLTAAVETAVGPEARHRQCIVFFGGNHATDPFFDSPAFQLELVMLEHLRRRVDRDGQDVAIVYLTHPAHGVLPAEIGGLVLRHATGLSYLSHPWYFVASHATGLYSSSLFEAAAFGASVFAPILAEDGLFADEVRAVLYAQPRGPDLAAILAGLDELLAGDERRASIPERLSILYPTLK